MRSQNTARIATRPPNNSEMGQEAHMVLVARILGYAILMVLTNNRKDTSNARENSFAI